MIVFAIVERESGIIVHWEEDRKAARKVLILEYEKAEHKIKRVCYCPDIFGEMEKSKIPYSVVKEVVKARGIFGYSSTDYFIAAPLDKLPELRDLGFQKSMDHKLVCEYDLRQDEIQQFKNKQDLFVQVKHTNDGRAYERKGNSLKEYLESTSKN